MRVSGHTHPMGGVAPRPLFKPKLLRWVDKDAVGFQMLRSKIPRAASDFWIPPCRSPLPRITRKRRPAARILESAIAVVVVVVFFFAIAIKFPEALRSRTRSWMRSGRRSSKLAPLLSLSLSHRVPITWSPSIAVVDSLTYITYDFVTIHFELL